MSSPPIKAPTPTRPRITFTSFLPHPPPSTKASITDASIKAFFPLRGNFPPRVPSPTGTKRRYKELTGKRRRRFTPTPAPRKPPPPLPSLKSLIDTYNTSYRCRDTLEQGLHLYDHVCGAPTEASDFKHTMLGYLEKIAPPFPPKPYQAIVQKRHLNAGESFFFRTDIHGDSRSLIKNLERFRDQGYLNENFEVVERYKGKITFVFGGDHGDRGPDTLKVARILAQFKMLNTKEVVILKGNHESIDLTKRYIAEREEGALEESEGYLEAFFNTMPHAILIGGPADEKGKRDYALCLHALIDPRIDLSPAFSDDDGGFYDLSYNPHAFFCEKIEDLTAHTKDFHSDADSHIKTLRLFLEAKKASAAEKTAVAPLLKHSPEDVAALDDKTLRRKAKLILRALMLRIDLEACIDTTLPAYENNQMLWGDPTYTPKKSDIRGIKLTPEAIKEYLSLMKTPSGNAKVLLKGHNHRWNVHSITTTEGEKTKHSEGFIHTMSSGGELKEYGDELDTAYFITVGGPKVSSWTNETLIREPQEASMHLAERRPLYKKRLFPKYNIKEIETLFDIIIARLRCVRVKGLTLHEKYELEGEDLSLIISSILLSLDVERRDFIKADFEKDSPITIKLFNHIIANGYSPSGYLLREPLEAFTALLALPLDDMKYIFDNFDGFFSQWVYTDYTYGEIESLGGEDIISELSFNMLETFIKAARRFITNRPSGGGGAYDAI
jgi:hypothetical protein